MPSNQAHLVFCLEIAGHFPTVDVGRSTRGELNSSLSLGLHLQNGMVGVRNRREKLLTSSNCYLKFEKTKMVALAKNI